MVGILRELKQFIYKTINGILNVVRTDTEDRVDSRLDDIRIKIKDRIPAHVSMHKRASTKRMDITRPSDQQAVWYLEYAIDRAAKAGITLGDSDFERKVKAIPVEYLEDASIEESLTGKEAAEGKIFRTFYVLMDEVRESILSMLYDELEDIV